MTRSPWFVTPIQVAESVESDRLREGHGEGGAAQHTQAWQYMQQACLTACAAFAQVPVLRSRGTASWMAERLGFTTLNAAPITTV
jgi:hypothetical protein